jgi:tetratricopeptide (TPR) repeat protein
MSPVLRMRLLVGLAAVAAAAIVAGVVYATRQDPHQPTTQCTQLEPTIVPGVASHNVAAVRAAFRKGPKRAALALESLAQEHPTDPVVQFNDATALACAGFLDDAVAAYRQAKKAGRNTYYGVRADNFLHPQFFRQGYPTFQYYGSDALLLGGQREQRQYHQVTAERLFARAARLHPENAEAQVAAAVGRFDMDDLSASFSRLGPLVRRFPKSQSVRFHLGLLLAWTGQRDQAVTEFRAARALGPGTKLGQDSDSFLRGLSSAGTGTTKR